MHTVVLLFRESAAANRVKQKCVCSLPLTYILFYTQCQANLGHANFHSICFQVSFSVAFLFAYSDCYGYSVSPCL